MTNVTTKGVPAAKDAMNKFKFEVANEIGVPLKQGYNGDLTSAQAGYVGGYMVKNVCPERIQSYSRHRRVIGGHKQTIKYVCAITT